MNDNQNLVPWGPVFSVDEIQAIMLKTLREYLNFRHTGSTEKFQTHWCGYLLGVDEPSNRAYMIHEESGKVIISLDLATLPNVAAILEAGIN